MYPTSNSSNRTIVVLHGDQTGEELLQEALRVLAPQVIGLDLNFQHFDLSLANRRLTQNGVVREPAAAMNQAGLGIKAATITPPESNDVGSPNAIGTRGDERADHVAAALDGGKMELGSPVAVPDLWRPGGGRRVVAPGSERIELFL